MIGFWHIQNRFFMHEKHETLNTAGGSGCRSACRTICDVGVEVLTRRKCCTAL
jgi:hypothetical protein